MMVVSFQVSFMTFLSDDTVSDIAKRFDYIALLLMSGSVICIVFILSYGYKMEQLGRVQNEKLALLRKEEKINRDYYMKLYEKNEEINRYHHDVKHYIRMCKDLMKNHKYEQAVNVLDNVDNGICSATQHISYSGNMIIDAVINGVLGDDIENDRVKFEYRGLLPNNLGISAVDLCSVISNALENARNAVGKLQNKASKEKIITMSGAVSGNVLFINISNAVEDGMHVIMSARDSNSLCERVRTESACKTEDKHSDGHGFGLENIKRIAEANNGEAEYSIADNIFNIEISMEISIKNQ
jgi:hypothetical protein